MSQSAFASMGAGFMFNNTNNVNRPPTGRGRGRGRGDGNFSNVNNIPVGRGRGRGRGRGDGSSSFGDNNTGFKPSFNKSAGFNTAGFAAFNTPSVDSQSGGMGANPFAMFSRQLPSTLQQPVQHQQQENYYQKQRPPRQSFSNQEENFQKPSSFRKPPRREEQPQEEQQDYYEDYYEEQEEEETKPIKKTFPTNKKPNREEISNKKYSGKEDNFKNKRKETFEKPTYEKRDKDKPKERKDTKYDKKDTKKYDNLEDFTIEVDQDDKRNIKESPYSDKKKSVYNKYNKRENDEDRRYDDKRDKYDSKKYDKKDGSHYNENKYERKDTKSYYKKKDDYYDRDDKSSKTSPRKYRDDGREKKSNYSKDYKERDYSKNKRKEGTYDNKQTYKDDRRSTITSSSSDYKKKPQQKTNYKESDEKYPSKISRDTSNKVLEKYVSKKPTTQSKPLEKEPVDIKKKKFERKVEPLPSTSRYVEEDEEEEIIYEESKKVEKKIEKKIEEPPSVDKKAVNAVATTFSSEKHHLREATAIIGTCKTMCPDSEIAEREMERDLSVFEMEPGTEHFAKAIGKYAKAKKEWCVKKYRRAAAATQVPSPAVIRPPSVLKRTLNYLVNEILDRKDYPYYEVYLFVRDRARSIVQDLTFQNLREEQSVDLHEIITRFHILSHHKLSNMGEEYFDSHQNMELLNKWLKSLQEFYEELRIKGIECENEPEFTCYFILTRLYSDQEIAKTLRNLPKHILETPEIKFAMEVYSAICLRNYVKFFKLVKKATYLNACILHTYFTRVREEALQVMNRSYNAKVKDLEDAPTFNLSNLINILGFENDEEAVQYCKHYGIYCKDDYIVFNYTPFVFPAKRVRPYLSESLIESKVRGIPFSDITNGKLKKPFQRKKIKRPSVVIPNEVTTTVLPSPKVRIQTPIIEEPTVSSPLRRRSPEEQQPIYSITGNETNVNLRKEPTPTNLKLSIPTTPREIPTDSFKQPTVISPIPKRISPIKSPVKTPTMATSFPENVPTSIEIEEIPEDEEVMEPTKEEIELELLRKREEELRIKALRKYFNIWKSNAKQLKNHRLMLEKTISLLSESELPVTNTFTQRKTQIQVTTEKLKKLESIEKLYQRVDIAPTVFKSLIPKQKHFENIFWKLLIVTNDFSEANNHLQQWFCTKLVHEASSDILPSISTLSKYTIKGRDINLEDKELESIICNKKLHLCVKRCDTENEISKDDLKGTSSILYFLSLPKENHVNLHQYWKDEINRLSQSLSSLSANYPLTKVPLLLIYDKEYFKTFDITNMKAEATQLISEIPELANIISKLECQSFDFLKFIPKLTDKYINLLETNLLLCLSWICKASSIPPIVNSYDIRDIIEDSLDNYFQHLLTEEYYNTMIKEEDTPYLPINLQDYIAHFNYVINHLKVIIENDLNYMKQYSWPVPEFMYEDDWNRDNVREDILLLLRYTHLPNYKNEEKEKLKLDDPKTLLSEMFSYCVNYLKLLLDYSGDRLPSDMLPIASVIMDILTNLLNQPPKLSIIIHSFHKIFMVFVTLYLDSSFVKPVVIYSEDKIESFVYELQKMMVDDSLPSIIPRFDHVEENTEMIITLPDDLKTIQSPPSSSHVMRNSKSRLVDVSPIPSFNKRKSLFDNSSILSNGEENSTKKRKSTFDFPELNQLEQAIEEQRCLNQMFNDCIDKPHVVENSFSLYNEKYLSHTDDISPETLGHLLMNIDTLTENLKRHNQYLDTVIDDLCIEEL